MLTVEAPTDGAGDAKRERSKTMRFGSVQAKVVAQSPATKTANVALGQVALKRAKTGFLKRGVSLRHGKSVPVFFADPREPSILIRRLDGHEERGKIVDGAFVPAE